MNPDPEMLVTSLEALALVPTLARNSVRNWLETKKLFPRGKRKPLSGSGGIRFVFRLGDILDLRKHFLCNHSIPCPPGHVRSLEASARLGKSEARVRRLAAAGTLKAIGVPWSPTQTMWFICETAIAERLADAERAMILPLPPIARPLISADDRVCLRARREKFEAAGRIFRWNWRKVLDGRKRVG